MMLRHSSQIRIFYFRACLNPRQQRAELFISHSFYSQLSSRVLPLDEKAFRANLQRDTYIREKNNTTQERENMCFIWLALYDKPGRFLLDF